MTTDTPRRGTAPLPKSDRDSLLPPLAALAAAVLGHLPILGTWWCRDDWGLLARAAGVIERPAGLTARWLSQQLYWQATWPLWGLHAAPHAMVRLLLHGLSALLVVRLGRRGGLAPAGAALAGFAFAASPLAFTPLYWAAGIQELLAATLALLAIDLWLSAGRRGLGAVIAATVAAAGAMLAKESALGLGLLLGVLLWAGAGPRGRDRAAALTAVALLLAAAAGAGRLATRVFDTGAGSAYQTAGVTTALPNLGVFGRWLADPGPVVGFTKSWTFVITGAVLMLAWAVWGAWRWRRGQRLPLAALAGTLLGLAPVLPLRHHVAPYQAYLAAAGWTLALGSLLPRRMPLPRLALLAALGACCAWGLFTCHVVMTRCNGQGQPVDDIVRASRLSSAACAILRGVDTMGGSRPVREVTLLQFPIGPGALENAQRNGELAVGRTDLFEALGGNLGPRLVAPTGVAVRWRNGLVTAPDSALVLVEAGSGLRPWGRTRQAALYAALTDVGLGNFERARAHLRRAATLGDRASSFTCDESLLPVPLAQVTGQREAFIDWTAGLLTQGVSGVEVSGLQRMYFNLLCACTGRSLEDLTRGSRAMVPGEPQLEPDVRNARQDR
jgi:hypothetical protein